MGSGFNLLSLKKEEKSNSKSIYKRHVVAGDDLFSVALYLELVKQHGSEQVALVCPHQVTENDLIPLGPNTLRGQINIDLFKRLFSDVELNVIEGPSEFYKELKWRPFGGRAKSEKLLFNEEFFTQKRADFNVEELFTFLKENDLYARLEKERLNEKITQIKTQNPNDLAEPAFFNLGLATGDILECEHFYWAYGPRKFYELYKDKASLSNEFVSWSEDVIAPSALYVRLEFDRKLCDKKETLFIPLSYTYDHGHFIGEFRELENGHQVAEFVTFMQKEETTEEEISKKIRQLKKNIKKIFNDSEATISSEFIKLTEDSGCLKIDDKVYSRLKDEMRNLSMLSFNAPIENSSVIGEYCEDSELGPSFLSRALGRHQEIVFGSSI